MDSEYMATPVQPGEVQCILCAHVINFNNGNQQKFFGHMKNHHKVSINHIFVFGIHFMDDHSVGQIVDNFKQDYYNLIHINEDKGVKDFDSVDGEMELSNTAKSNDQSISAYVNKIIEYPPEKCDECENEFNVHYKKCNFHENNTATRKHISRINESNIDEGDNCSPYYDPKSRKISDENSNGDKKINNTKTLITTPIESSEYFKKYPNQILSKGSSDKSTFDIIDETLPEGWRVKKMTRNRTTKKCKSSEYYIYLSPDEKILRSRVAVIEYMKVMNIYSQDQFEIAKMHNFRKKSEEKLLNKLDQIKDFSIVSSSSSEDTLEGAGTVAIIRNNYGYYADNSTSEYSEEGIMTDAIVGASHENGNKKRDEEVRLKMTLGVGLHGERQWQCTGCDYSHKKKTRVVNHIKLKHLDEKVLCKLCNAPFPARNYLKMHLKNVHKNNEKHEDHDTFNDQMDSFNIDVVLDEQQQIEDFNNISSDTILGASTVATDSNNYAKEIKLHSVGPIGLKQFLCHLCDYKGTTRSHLTVHMRTHTGVKPYECEYCGRGFGALCAFIVHKRIHTGEKPYKCDICQKPFRKRWNMKMHKVTHTGGKPFPCDRCSVSFACSATLKTHKRKQIGNNLLTCLECSMVFCLSSDMKFHKQKVHNDDNKVKCDKCLKVFSKYNYLRKHQLNVDCTLTKFKN